jgi:hypothetical protein
MNYVYHGVPKRMEGNILHPLSILKTQFPEVYSEEVRKYAGREHVMENRIPIFNCLWNDVLHFACVPPIELKNALVEAGMAEAVKLSFYKIDTSILDKENCIVYLNNKREKGELMSESDFTQYDQNNLKRYSIIPQIAKDKYKEAYIAGKTPLMFLFIPHILYRGSVNVSSAEIITV